MARAKLDRLGLRSRLGGMHVVAPIDCGTESSAVSVNIIGGVTFQAALRSCW